MNNLEIQKAFEDIYSRQKCEQVKEERQDLLEEIEVLIYDALKECVYVKDNLIVSHPNINSIYKSTLSAIISIKSAAKELETLTKMLVSE